MSHVRQQIREAAATAVTGLTTSGIRVYQSRVHMLSDAELPCLLVNTDTEAVATQNIGAPAILERHLDLTVKAVAKSSANLDDTLDTMAAEVETALGNTTLSGLVKALALESIEVEMTGDSDRPVGIMSMKWRAAYYTMSNAPSVSI